MVSNKMECYICGNKRLPANIKDREIVLNTEQFVCRDCTIKLICLEQFGLIKINNEPWNKHKAETIKSES
jgi:hypothetical protein